MRGNRRGRDPALTRLVRRGSKAALVCGVLAMAASTRPGSAATAVGHLGAYPMVGGGAVPLTYHCGSAPNLRYYGGPVLQNVKVWMVNWGSHINASVTGQMPQFYADVVASPWLDWLSEYGTIGRNGLDGHAGSDQSISRGTFAGSVTIAPSLCAGAGSPGSCTVTDAQVQAELVAQMGAGNLTAPTTGCDGLLDTVYMINFHNSVTIAAQAGDSCVNYCAYHGKGSYQGKSFAYAVLPDFFAGNCSGMGCGPNTEMQNTTAVASHELAESITDPLSPAPGRPLAWFDQTCGEIADICILQYGTINPSGTPWTVTQLWSNQVGDCITTKASLPPVCTGLGVPAGCRLCSCADDDQGAPGCSGSAPTCGAAGYCVMPAMDGGAADGGAMQPDAGTDAGAVADSGSASDGSASVDGAASTDASGSGDASRIDDASMSADAPAVHDGAAGSDATGSGDATASDDALASGEAGANGGTPGSSGGCGCHTVRAREVPVRVLLVGGLGLIGAVMRRRRRRR